MKLKTKILLIFVIIITLFLSFTPNIVKGSVADIYYDFENDVILDSQNPFNNFFNLRNPIIYSQDYAASYSFTNETDGSEGTDIVYIDISAGGNATIISEFNNHDKVIEYLPDIAYNGIDNLFDVDYTTGTIELWINSQDISAIDLQMGIWEGATSLILFGIAPSGFYYYDIHVRNDFGNPIDNTWYHFKVEFYNDDTFDLYNNNELIVSSSDFYDPMVVGADRFRMRPSSTVFYSYIDAVGYSWLSNYTINDNRFPVFTTNTDVQEINRYEFAMSDVNTFYQFLDDDVSGWSDIEIGGGDTVESVDEIDGTYDRLISVSSNVIGDVRGIQRDDFLLNGTFFNITFGIIFMLMEETGGGGVNTMWFYVYSSDYSRVVNFFVKADNTIWMSNGVSVEDTGMVVQQGSGFRYDFNVFIDYEMERTFLRVKENEVLLGTYDVRMNVLGKEGLRKIKPNIIFTSDTDTYFCFIDYIGVYDSNGNSAINSGVDAFAICELDLESSWNFANNNLFDIIGNGFFHIGSVSNAYTDNSLMREVKNTTNYINTSVFYNIYNNFEANIPNSRLIITVLDGLFFVDYIYIRGCRLKQSFNEYFLEFDYSGIDSNKSYFFVDDNKLQFTLTSNDTDTEYIQATFNISDISSTERAISFRGSILNNAFGYFVIDYFLGVSTIEIPIFEKTTRAILPSNKTIDSFIVLITDNDVDSVLGTTTGYVSQPKLLVISGLGLPIITSGLIEMMIPLIMIMIPTLLISQGFGKEGKKLIIPLFFIFSLITTITLIIPIWIFFIILFGTGLFLAKNKEIEVK